MAESSINNQQVHDSFLIEMKTKMLNKQTIVDSAIFDINQDFFEFAFKEGGDDLISQFDSNKFVYQMTIRLNPEDIIKWDSNTNDDPEIDLQLYINKRDEVLKLIEMGQLVIE